MPEFWVSSGHHLSHRTESGGLAVTPALLLAYLARPELVPPPEACAAERALHARLLADPCGAVTAAEMAAIADPDARENWALMLALRDRLVAAGTVEAAYLGIVRANGAGLPALFLDQLVHLILRNALDGIDDPYLLRAGELFFRPQRVAFEDPAVLLADAEVVAAHESQAAAPPLSVMLGHEPAIGLDVMEPANAWSYWSRSDAFTMALNIGSDPRSRAALARVIEIWLCHLAQLAVTVEPIARIEDDDWRWFIGLDAEATRIGNALWQGQRLDPAAQARVLALFRMDRCEPLRGEAAGAWPVYLILAMGPDRSLRLKPQNLLAGLPPADARAA